jgi:membrane protein YqaA with SNARE-associated domain
MDIYSIAQYLVNNYGYAGLFVVAFTESFIQPIPPDLFIVGASAFGLDPLNCALISTIGSLFGGITGRMLGYKFGTPLFIKLFGENNLNKGELFFNKYGTWGVSIAGFSPLPYKIIAWLAGIFEMNLLHFCIGTLIGRFPRFLIIALFGHKVSIYFGLSP